jgi:hypothetical protein
MPASANRRTQFLHRVENYRMGYGSFRVLIEAALTVETDSR